MSCRNGRVAAAVTRLAPSLLRATGDLYAPVTDGDRPVGWLCAWRDRRERPHSSALPADGRLLTNDGPACRVTLLLLAADARRIDDDPAQAHARRCVLRDGRGRFSIPFDEPVHRAGAFTVAPADHPQEVSALGDDPLACSGQR